MNKSVMKGSYEYLKARKRRTIFWTLLLFAVSASLFIAGVVTTGTKKNLLTIVAVLGVLPAARSFVTSFMYYKAKGCSADWYDTHHELIEQFKHGMRRLPGHSLKGRSVPLITIFSPSHRLENR